MTVERECELQRSARERREQPRVGADRLSLRIHFADVELDSTEIDAHDISATGLGISAWPMPAETFRKLHEWYRPIRVKIHLADEPVLRLSASVAWGLDRYTVASERHKLGLNFVELSGDQQLRIFGLIDRLSAVS